MSKPLVVFDCEVYPNFFFVAFKSVESGKVRAYWRFEDELGFVEPLDSGEIKRILGGTTTVSFNGNHFDVPVLTYAMRGATCSQIKALSNDIINQNLKSWDVERNYNITLPKLDHIDLIEVAPGKASLKLYGGRMHCPKLQDLPLDHMQPLTLEQAEIVKAYCINDLDTTIALYNSLKEQIALRSQMSVEFQEDLRSKSDAQIAEAVIRKKVSKLLGDKVYAPTIPGGTIFKYEPPRFIRYTHQALKDMLDVVRRADFILASNGVVQMPPELADLSIAIGNGVYRMGIGGLHSSEKKVAHFAGDDHLLIDRDVTSYYPSIILNLGLYPKHMGEHFLTVYRELVDRRIYAKRHGDKVAADALKITINGSFGKLGSKWSALFAPDLMICVTLTGQLSLLMLIDMLEANGIPVVSANTDGIVIRCPKNLEWMMDNVVRTWEQWTGFQTEDTQYKAIYSRDVNNYIAIKAKGGSKAKGAYAPPALNKSPDRQICVTAVINYLEKGVAIEDTISQCKDIRQFICMQKVNGGAVWRDQFLGRVARWYYSTESNDPILYKINGYKVGGSDGSKPCMELPAEFPADLNLWWYVDEAYSILSDLGAM